MIQQINDCLDCGKCSFDDFEKQYTSKNSYSIGNPQAMLLGITNRCNMACPYCFEKHNDHDMKLETAISAVEWFLSVSKIKKPTIAFFGGEPLLKFDEIIVPIVEKYNEMISFDITTNGVLLDEDKVDFFRKYGITPLLSFDGIKEVQNSQRPRIGFNSYDTVMRNIPYYLLRFPNGSARSTLTKNSIPHIVESVKLLYDVGFKNIGFYVNAFEDWTSEDFLKYDEQLTLLGEWLYTNIPNVPHITNLEKSMEKVRNIDKLTIDNRVDRCGMGTVSCAITYDGKIIPCQEKISNPTTVIGDIYNGIDIKKAEDYITSYLEKIKDISCNKDCNDKIHLLCKSAVCPSRLEDMNFSLSSSVCYSNKALYRLAMRLEYLCGNTYKGKFFKGGI